MKRKKAGIIIGAVAALAVLAVGGVVLSQVLGNRGGSSADKVYVESVATITNQFTGTGNRFGGMVEAEKTSEITKDSERTVQKVYVSAGDQVEAGTKLFSYDTEEVELKLEQKKLELENMDNEIAGYQSQITELEKEKKTVPADQQFEYTTQIQTLQTTIKQSEYNKKSLKAEIEKIKKSVKNSVVKSDIAGVVKSINESGTDEYGNAAAYITILATGEFRIKGNLNEQNFGSISEGQQVLIRSRLDGTVTWTGTVTQIDTENTIPNNSNGYYMEAGETGTSSSYPFYVEVDSMEGLMIGQHVYIELDFGQTVSKEGIWLYSYYLVMDGDEAYVWADNGRGKLEQRKVELGEYDESMDRYEIVSGLTLEDAICWPMSGLYEGITTVTNEAEVDYTAPLYQPEESEPKDDSESKDDSEPIDGGVELYNATEVLE